jgi:[ribosomal protein S5]-alanine N-acetyltransferase
MIHSNRLLIRPFTEDDDTFIIELLNDPDWIRNIGDRKVHSPEDARHYLRNGPMRMMQRDGHSLMLVALADGTATPIGMCGILQREGLADVDLGYAFLPAYRGQGYAREAALATLEHGRDVLGLKRVVAITLPANTSSSKLLESVGMRFESHLQLANDAEQLALYSVDF